MKVMMIGLIPTVILIQLLGCATTGSDFADLIAEGSEIMIYEVFGMDCPGCHGGLENLVNKIPLYKYKLCTLILSQVFLFFLNFLILNQQKVS